MSSALSYAAITPARNEAENLRRLARCMEAQTAMAKRWIVVDNGSTDETVAITRELAERHAWVSLIEVPGETIATRGAPVVRAFHAGLDALGDRADVVVKLDADVSFEPHYFERQLGAFADDPKLGIAGGLCMEPLPGGGWEAARVTRGHVRGAVRAYRWECLQVVTPLEERMGWDGVDELKAEVEGWRIGTTPGLSFLHHRQLAARESRWTHWSRQGQTAHFMGYRLSYLIARTVYNTTRDPRAPAMLAGYATAAAQRRPRCSSEAAIAHLRELQSIHALPSRVREKLGRAE